jgi:alkyl hydroperoxide reductase subunit AhpC
MTPAVTRRTLHLHERHDERQRGLFHMSITIGDRAPAIQVPAYSPGRRNARITGPADHQGRWVVLGFHRAGEALDRLELQALGDLGAAFTGTEPVVLAASTDTWLQHAHRYADHPSLDRAVDHVLADTHHRLVAAFGVLEGDGRTRPATFVIDPDGVVRHAMDGGPLSLTQAA